MPTSHLINANVHRAKEGARVLEDIARFILRDEDLFLEVREIRHQIQIAEPIYNAKTDLGGSTFVENNVRQDIADIIQANSLRLQEALRVLEELESVANKKHQVKKLRYQAYDLHSRLHYSAKKYLKLRCLEGLYLIIDTDVISYPLEKIIDTINQSPVSIVQYRNKSLSKKNVFEGAKTVKERLDARKLLIINDHIDIAIDLADGVHLGQEDYPLARVRHILPNHFIFGISCHNLEEARAAIQLGASYIGVGCLFETSSKNDITPISIQDLKIICDTVSVPVCGIGGINTNNLDDVLSADVKMAALISHVWKSNNPLEVINQMHDKILRKE